MNENERLLLAMSELDDDIIIEAATPYRRHGVFHRLRTAAAVIVIGCFCVIAARFALSYFELSGAYGSSSDNSSYDKSENSTPDFGGSSPGYDGVGEDSNGVPGNSDDSDEEEKEEDNQDTPENNEGETEKND